MSKLCVVSVLATLCISWKQCVCDDSQWHNPFKSQRVDFNFHDLSKRLRGGADAASQSVKPQSPSVKSRRMFAYPWESLGNNDTVLDYYKVPRNVVSGLV